MTKKDATTPCGATKGKEVCSRPIGHVGMHHNGGNVTWKGPRPEKATETPKERMDAVFGGSATEPAKSRKRHEEGRWINDWTWEDARGVGYIGSTIPKHALKSKPQPSSAIKVHPAADALPMIDGPDFAALVDDIRANGVRHKIVLDHSGEWLVDGRNRKRACEQLGIEAPFELLPEGTNIAAYVISTNLKRRHLNESQRALIAAEIANLGQGQKKTRPGAGLKEGVTQSEAAIGAGVGERTVQRAKAVRENAVPELVEAVKSGKVDLKGAEQIAKLTPAKQRKLIKERVDTSKGPVRGGKLAALARQEEKREVVRKINEQQVAPVPVGPFRLIVVDWPWPYENSDQHEGSRGHIPYPAMSIEQALAMAPELEKLSHEDGAILAFWTTNAFMPDAVRIVDAWGFSWRTIYTWDKERDGVGTWGRGRTEHLIIAERGEVEHTLNEVSTLMRLPRREHSRKPDEMMALLEQHCPGPRLEMFAREPREQWASWGAEASKFTEAA